MKRQHISTSQTDQELRRMLKTGIPQAPQLPWFTRKVMNRLPDKCQLLGIGPFEAVCYTLAALVLLAGWGYTAYSALNLGLTPKTCSMIILLPLLTLFYIGIFAIPAVRRSL